MDIYTYYRVNNLPVAVVVSQPSTKILKYILCKLRAVRSHMLP